MVYYKSIHWAWCLLLDLATIMMSIEKMDENSRRDEYPDNERLSSTNSHTHIHSAKPLHCTALQSRASNTLNTRLRDRPFSVAQPIDPPSLASQTSTTTSIPNSTSWLPFISSKSVTDCLRELYRSEAAVGSLERFQLRLRGSVWRICAKGVLVEAFLSFLHCFCNGEFWTYVLCKIWFGSSPVVGIRDWGG